MSTSKKRPPKPRMLALAGARLSEIAAAIEWPTPGPPPLPLPVERAIDRLVRRHGEHPSKRAVSSP